MGTVHTHPLSALRYHVSGAIERGTAEAVTAIHPVITAADMATMSVHELRYFTDSPVNHVCAYRDFQRELRLEAARIEAANAYLARRRHEAHEARG